MYSTKSKSTSSTKHSWPDPLQEWSHKWFQDHHQKHNRKYHDNTWQSSSKYLDRENQSHSERDCHDKDWQYSRHHSSGGTAHRHAGHNQTKSLMTARLLLAIAVEDLTTPQIRNAQSMGNPNQWRRCMPKKNQSLWLIKEFPLMLMGAPRSDWALEGPLIPNLHC